MVLKRLSLGRAIQTHSLSTIAFEGYKSGPLLLKWWQHVPQECVGAYRYSIAGWEDRRRLKDGLTRSTRIL